jgi:ATP-binding cassette, subfamily B, bacterial
MDDHASPSRGRLLRAELRPRGIALVGLAGALVAVTALPLLGPQLMRRFVDGAAGGRPLSALVVLAVAYLVVALAGQGARLFAAWLAARTAWDVSNRLRERLATHALSLDLAFHVGRTPGELIERVDGDVEAVSEFIVAFLLDIVASALLLAGTLVLVTSEDVRLGLALGAYVGVVALILVRLKRQAVPALTAYRESVAQLFGQLEERLAGAEDIRANGAGAHVLRRFDESSAGVYRANLRANGAQARLFGAVYLGSALGTAVLLGLGLVLHRRGALSIGGAVALFQYTQLVREPLEAMTDQLQQLQEAQAGAGRLTELLEERSVLPSPPGGGVSLPPGPLSLELDDVSFAYADDGEEVLRQVSLAVAAGRSLGLVGRTGSGKTTLARLLLRLSDPTEGAVRLGGVDLRQVAPAELRRRVAVVTQDVQLFAASVRDNLTLFRSDDGGDLAWSDDDRLTGVLTDLGLGPWLRSLPDGLDTELGPGGTGLSAGEAQLLAFARAFLGDAGLVILDEASSRLDPATEALVERAVGRLLSGRTAVLIAHRLSSLDRVDEVAVLHGGRIVERGARADLARDAGSRFARLLATGRTR